MSSEPETEATEEQTSGSAAAGALVLLLLGGGAEAVVWAVSPTAGVLCLWGAGTAALYWAVRRRVSDSSATPPPGGDTPSGGEKAGHEHGPETTLVRREGMLIYLTPDPINPARTAVDIVREEASE